MLAWGRGGGEKKVKVAVTEPRKKEWIHPIAIPAPILSRRLWWLRTRADPGFLVAGDAKSYEIRENLIRWDGSEPLPRALSIRHSLLQFGCSGNLGSFTRNKGTCFPVLMKNCTLQWGSQYNTDFDFRMVLSTKIVWTKEKIFFKDFYLHSFFLGGLSLHLNHLYSIAIGKLRLAIWDTSFWTFWLKFGHKGHWDIS